ncbi:hypothetical protein F5050DRAFT_1710098 [Lentinula boryana]|uniref:Uncharacterized protein n=1 Tax=Lentinula boryana TaxID=40481 RepID=A0ABQ8QKF3_9AGAR|nr:hypothetical protein F5050DRAFT_1710098 [Lentinula boryana]
MLLSISYVLLGIVAVIHAIPVDSGITYPTRQTAPSHPPHVDPRPPQPHSQLKPISKDKIYIRFMHPEPTGTGCPVFQIKEEMSLILEKYRQHINVNKPFEFSFLNRYDENIESDRHDFEFWGEGVGGDCGRSESPCEVVYNDDIVEVERHNPSAVMATISTASTDGVLDVTYAIRHLVLLNSVHPVSDEILAPGCFEEGRHVIYVCKGGKNERIFDISQRV